MPLPGRDCFTDPATGDEYNWHVNHNVEQAFGKQRNVERTARTGFQGYVRQQGDDGPLILQFQGEILHRAQYQQMWHFYHLCETQTIYFTDFFGDEAEVQITHFTPTRVRVAKNPSDPSIPFHRWDYTIEMDVVRVISGDLLTEGIVR